MTVLQLRLNQLFNKALDQRLHRQRFSPSPTKFYSTLHTSFRSQISTASPVRITDYTSYSRIGCIVLGKKSNISTPPTFCTGEPSGVLLTQSGTSLKREQIPTPNSSAPRIPSNLMVVLRSTSPPKRATAASQSSSSKRVQKPKSGIAKETPHSIYPLDTESGAWLNF
ncbi:hypothetical protein K440DRAFT_591348 [Wilcoxina mikolae CBS 423.85]|nr:hypothetical protein K440DRAFT_591348 [Wilcoxina mikolae CBS 423.85]